MTTPCFWVEPTGMCDLSLRRYVGGQHACPSSPWGYCNATNSDHLWDRSGDPKANPPTVSATPSILTSHYHGFLTGGILTDDLGGHS